MKSKNASLTSSWPARLAVVGILFFLWQPLTADGKLNFAVGDVVVDIDGNRSPAQIGMTIPANGVVITGEDGQAAVYNFETGAVANVGPNSKLAISSMGGGRDANSPGDILKQNLIETNRVTAVAGVRGRFVRKPCMPRNPYVMSGQMTRKDDWDLYKQGKFEEVMKNTANAGDADLEGRFLRAASNYFQNGAKKSAEIEKDLTWVKANNNIPLLQYDSDRFLGSLYFQQGDYNRALQVFQKLNEKTKVEEMDELSIMMLIKLNRYTGRKDAADELSGKVRKYCSESKLVKSVLE